MARGSSIFIVACRTFNYSTWPLSGSMWDLVPWSGIKPERQHWEHGVLDTGPLGKSLVSTDLIRQASYYILWHNKGNLEINNTSKTEKFTNLWKLKSTFYNNPMDQKDITIEIRKYLRDEWKWKHKIKLIRQRKQC